MLEYSPLSGLAVYLATEKTKIYRKITRKFLNTNFIAGCTPAYNNKKSWLISLILQL
jgi:hypothetical protein